jgi:hypothetical protein
MTTAAEFQSKVAKAEVNMDRLDGIVNGGPTTVVGTDGGNVPSIAKLEADLRAQVDAGLADLTVSTIPGLQAALDAFAVNITRFGAPDSGGVYPATALTLAIAATPDGGCVYIPGNVRVKSPGTITRSNIAIRGGKMPSVNAAGTALEKGAVIEGSLVISGDNLDLQSFGVDSGASVCTAVGSAGMDGLVVHDAALAVIRKNIVCRDLIGLCKDTSVAYHAVLLEGLEGLDATNIRGKYGRFNVVVKARKSILRGLYGYSAGHVGIYIKSDSYAPCEELDVSGLFYDDAGAGYAAIAGVSLYAATATMARVKVRGIEVIGGNEGVKLVGAPRSTYPTNAMEGIRVSEVVSVAANAYSFSTYGALVGCSITNLTLDLPVSKKALLVQEDAYSVHVDGVFANVIGADASTVDLRGGFTATNIRSVVTRDLTNPSGITLAPNLTQWRLGDCVGTVNYDSGASGLLNGWTAAYSNTPQAKLRDNRIWLSGRLSVPATPWTGKEEAYQCGIGPQTIQNMYAMAYNASTQAMAPVFMSILGNGRIKFDLLTNSGAFPSGISYVELDGLSFPVGGV